VQALVDKAYGGNPPMTEKPKTASPSWKPQISTSSETLEGSGDPLLEQYAEGSFAIKLLQTYYPILLRGVDTPITSSPRVLVRSGRTSWSKPNFQNPPQKGGFRDCFIPRPGKVFASIDYSALEMCTLAQVCLTLFGFSRMAEAINAGRDLHCGFAGQVLRSRGFDLPDDDVERILGKGLYEGQAPLKDHPHYAECKKARQEAKAGNFGFPGGLGVAAFVKFAKGSGVTLTFNQAEDLRKAWFARWEEMRPYFDMISNASDDSVDGRFTVKQLGSNRLRGGCSYTSGANTWFQGLAADGAKAAMWALYKACYIDTTSPLYGVRMWAFIHDEFLFEGPEETAHLWAPEASRLMVEAMRKYCPDVAIGAEPALMYRWLKDAEPVYNQEGKLIPWTKE
jgi:DNA polymerase I-like protein with 3'-5' exonuclease and polymerase domains